MLRPSFPGHRRYSITHRAVQRLRELVPNREEEDDESLRDRLDTALGTAEDSGKAIRTLDAMLGEPQTLIPIGTFGDVLYAIIKEDTVVTVLPQGHGEEILQRGQAMEQRVASGQAKVRPNEPREEERWDGQRRRWRKEAPQPVVIERIVRGNGNGANGNGANGHAVAANEFAVDDHGNDSGLDGHAAHEDTIDDSEAEDELLADEDLDDIADDADDADGEDAVDDQESDSDEATVRPISLSAPRDIEPEGPIAEALARALDVGRRRAAIAALRELLEAQDPQTALLPLWKSLADEGVPESMTVGDLIDAVAGIR